MTKVCKEKDLEAGHALRGLGIKDLVRASCQIDGLQLPALTASADQWANAGFSSTVFTGLLGNAANKIMQAAYNAVPSVSRIVAKKLSANDFKTHTGYRLTGDTLFEEVGDGGEIKLGTLGEESYSYTVDTYGKRMGLTRKDIVNDDLGAFTEIPRMLGRGAALKLEDLFWTLVLANTGSFFSAGNGNYIDGATTALSTAGLDQASQALEEQEDADGNPILVNGSYLVVPPILKGTAQRLYKSTTMKGDTDEPDQNIYAGLYSPLSTAYLKSAPLEWYLLGNPADIACFGIAFLNGNEMPVIEAVSPGANYLGTAWRGYHDFGVCQIDKRGGVKSKGEA